MKKILITGGKGLIGQAIARKYINEGHEVYLWDNMSNPYVDYSNFVGIDLYQNYKYSTFSIKDVFQNLKFDIVSHQASFVSVGESQYQIDKYMKNNIGCTSELLQAMIDTNNFPKILLYASSMGPYGEGRFVCNNCGVSNTFNIQRSDIDLYCPNCKEELDISSLFITEDSERIPQSFYGVSKMAQEEMIRVFANTYNVPSIALRYFSVYGTDNNPNNPYTGVISIIVNKILNSDVIELNEDGEQTRDLIHCDDIADLHYIITDEYHEDSPLIFEAFNVGTGESYSMKEIVGKVQKYFNSDKKVIYNYRVRKGDIKYSKAEIFKVASYYPDWHPERKVDDAIKLYCSNIKKNLTKYIKEDTCRQADEILESKGLFNG